jgi:putative tricarboxylic transport membrane protein
MSLSILSSLFVTALGIIYTISTLALPPASIGRTYEPKIFPGMLGFSLVIMGAVLLIQEIQKRSAGKTDESDTMKFGTSERQIALTIVNGFVYALWFNTIGYVFSTIIFLLCELFIFDGFKVWKKAAVVAISFTTFAYCIFDLVLGIYLPPSPLGIF